MANGQGLEGRGGQGRPAPSSSASSLPLHAKQTLMYARGGRGLASTFLMMGGWGGEVKPGVGHYDTLGGRGPPPACSARRVSKPRGREKG